MSALGSDSDTATQLPDVGFAPKNGHPATTAACLFGAPSNDRPKKTGQPAQFEITEQSVQLLLGHTKLESTVRYLGIEKVQHGRGVRLGIYPRRKHITYAFHSKGWLAQALRLLCT